MYLGARSSLTNVGIGPTFWGMLSYNPPVGFVKFTSLSPGRAVLGTGIVISGAGAALGGGGFLTGAGGVGTGATIAGVTGAGGAGGGVLTSTAVLL